MIRNRKSEGGIDYTLESRSKPSIAEGVVFWQGSDGSVLELTDEEQAERDTSRSLDE